MRRPRCCGARSHIARPCAIRSAAISYRRILDNEEERVDTLEHQLDMIGQMALENYSQLQSRHTEVPRSGIG